MASLTFFVSGPQKSFSFLFFSKTRKNLLFFSFQVGPVRSLTLIKKNEIISDPKIGFHSKIFTQVMGQLDTTTIGLKSTRNRGSCRQTNRDGGLIELVQRCGTHGHYVCAKWLHLLKQEPRKESSPTGA